MRGLPAIASTESFRVRRWDAVVLGGATPGLIAAICLAKRGARVLVLEEAKALAGFQGLREPFLMTGAESDQVLGACLRALGIPLIDQRRLVSRDLALQVVLPDARLDLGRPHLSIDELTAWGLAKPEVARAMLSALQEASEAERLAMLSGVVVRSGRRLGRGPRRSQSEVPLRARDRATRLPPARGLPAEVTAAPPRVATLLRAVCKTLAHRAGAPISPEAQARMLGSLLGGGALLGGGDGWLRGMLRRRLTSLFGEFRSVAGPIRLVTVAQQPGLAIGDSDEIWAGRALVLNAPRAALARALAQEVPDLLRGPPVTHNRVFLHLQGPRSVLPESMSDSLVWLRDPALPLEGTNLIAIRCFAGRGRDAVDVLASAVVPVDAAREGAVGDEIERALRDLLPFSEASLVRVPTPQPSWDSDALLSDSEPGAGWPHECDVRVSSRPLVYALERSWLGGLGFEGDLLLGWRGGDAIAGDLS